MTKILKNTLAILLTVLFTANTNKLSAQVGKPVTVIVSLTPPYTPFLNEYASFGVNKLQVTLIANDSRMQNYPVKLQMFIQRYGTGIIMQTAEYAAIPPIYLTGGTSEILDGASLSQYFSAQNNVFNGFDQSQYIQTGRIPDGQYRIGFRVTDARRSDVILSETVYSQPGWFLLNDPPQLNLPLNGAAEEVQNIQHVKLEWFPRHLGSLNSAFAVNYQTELYALRVPGTNPATVVASLPPDYIGVTGQNLFFLSQNEYLLEPGVEYAWRVKAYADDGLTLFQNNGYSEVRTFVYGSLCPEVENTDVDILGTEEVEFSWDTDPKHTAWQIQLRKENSEDDWYTQQTTTVPFNIQNILSEGTAYEYQVKSLCNFNESDYSPLKTFSTEVFELPENFECGAGDTVEITNFTPKLSIFIGEIIYNGEFPVRITEISGSNGIFSGKGRMRIPMLANVQVNMQFENIKVNELNQVYEGEMVSVYNPDSPFFIEDITDYLAEGDQVGNIITGQDSAAITLGYPIDENTTIIINGDGTITIDGSTITIDDLASGTTIEDSEGTLYAVDENGNITEIGTSGGAVSPEDYNNTASLYDQLDSTITVVFENNGTWAFDNRNPDYADSPFDNEYQLLGDYDVPWKFIPLGKSDKIKARVTKGDIEDPNKVKFLTPAGTEFFAEYNNGWYELEATGGKTGDGVEIYAIYMPDDSTKRSLGKIRIASYPKKEMTVSCIPVGNFSIDGKISEELLNQIYAPYYIHWTVTTDEPFTETSWDTGDEGLQASGSGFWSEYTDEMQALRDAYTEQRGIDKESLYLFFFENGNSDENQLSGDMPLKSRFGFIFNAGSESSDKITKTAAHELGHGAFQLKHTFNSKYDIDKYKTQNLMDYNGGIELVKYQWDVIHDPQNKLFNWAQDEEEGEHAIVINIEGLNDFKNEPDGTFTFISRAGLPITVPGDITEVVFSTGDSNTCDNDEKTPFRILPFGTLSSFKWDEKNYRAKWDCVQNMFVGYATTANEKYFDTLTNITRDSAIVGFPAVNSGNIIYKVGKISVTPETGGETYRAAGTYEAFDFLADRISDITKINEIYAEFKPAYDVDVKQFILDHINQNTLNGFYGNNAYVFIHATQLQKYEILKGCFKNGIPGRMLQFITKNVSYYTPAGMNPGTYETHEVPAFSDSYEPKTADDLLLVNHWKDFDVNYYPVISNALENFNIPSDATKEDVYNLVKPLLGDDIITDNWNCFFEKYTVDEKIAIINKLIEGNSILDRSEESIVNLIATINNPDSIQLFIAKLKGVNNNYSLFTSIWDELDQPERIQFSFLLTGWINSSRTESNEDLTNAYVNDYYNYINNNYFGDYDYAVTNVFTLYNTNFIESFQNRIGADIDGNNIELEEEYSDLLNIYPRLRRFTGAPFDDVVILIQEDFPEYGFEAGQQITVPAILLYNISNNINIEHRLAGIRVLFNALAIATAPVTAGGSTALLYIEIFAASIDIAITVNRSDFENEFGVEAAQFWDATYGLYRLYILGRGFGLFNFTTTNVNGLTRITDFQLFTNKVEQAATSVIQHGNNAEKLDFLKEINKLLNALDNVNIRELAKASQMRDIVMGFRTKVLRSFGTTADIIVDNGSLVYKQANGSQLGLAKIDFINNVPTLTQNIRWLPTNANPPIIVENVITKFGQIGYLENSIQKIGDIEVVSASSQQYLRLANGVGKFTIKQIDDFVLIATQQNNKLKVMLGKFDNGASTGYVSRAGSSHTYFDMGNKWDEALQMVGGDLDEMWRINKKFIDEQKALGKEFFLSHNPLNADGFYKREIDYLTQELNGQIIQVNNNTWKILW